MSSEKLYHNLNIMDIVKKYKVIDRQTCMKCLGLNPKKPSDVRKFSRRLRKIKKEIIRLKRGKYKLYIWNDQSNPFIKDRSLLLEFDADYNRKFAKWYLAGLIYGDKFLQKAEAKMDKRLKVIRRTGTRADKQIIKYIKNMFLRGFRL